MFLSNRVHPDGHGDVTALRARVASIVASAVPDARLPPSTEMAGADVTSPASVASPAARRRCRRGIDVLRAEGFARLNGRHVGLLTNQSGRASDGTSTIDLLHAAKGLTLVALLSPEHGIRGALDESVPSSTDAATGLPIYSLYGATRRPTGEMLKGIDTIVVDLQDVGVRFYTFPTTVAYVMEEAAKRQMKVVVLDRPNPVNGWQIEGPSLETAAVGFTGYLASMPIRHGLTIGELARLYNGEAQHRLRPRRGRDEGLGAERMVRRHGPRVDQPVAEHAQSRRGDALPGHRHARVRESLGGPRHRHALRADRRAVDRRSRAG